MKRRFIYVLVNKHNWRTSPPRFKTSKTTAPAVAELWGGCGARDPPGFRVGRVGQDHAEAVGGGVRDAGVGEERVGSMVRVTINGNIRQARSVSVPQAAAAWAACWVTVAALANSLSRERVVNFLMCCCRACTAMARVGFFRLDHPQAARVGGGVQEVDLDGQAGDTLLSGGLFQEAEAVRQA